MRSVAALLLAATLAVLTGCSAPEPAPPAASPSATAEPVFASDEEALAAAEKAYTEYLAAFDEVAHDGGREPERLADHVAPDELQKSLAEFGAFVTADRHTRGNTGFDDLSLQQYEVRSGFARVIVYLCLDVSEVRVLDANGKDVTPAREARQPLVVTLVSANRGSEALVLEESEQWSSNFCE
jgi:hypothetical protein